MWRCYREKLSGPLACIILLIVAPVTFAQESSSSEESAPEPRTEAGFVNELLDVYGLTDIAQAALDELKAQKPNDNVQNDFLQARIKVKQGKTDDAEKIIAGFKDGNPKAQAIKLELAIYYHQVGEAAKSKKLFDDFFAVYKDKQPTDPDVLNAYINASYVLAEIYKNEGKWGEAIKYYKQLISGAKENKIQRIFMVEAANAYVELAKGTKDEKKQDEQLKQADKYARDAMWKYDDVFGRAVVSLVNIILAKGDRPKALELINEYNSDINGIENQLRDVGAMQLSPRAHLRVIKGDIYFDDMKEAHEKGDTAGAKTRLQKAAVEYINAFLKYEGNDYSDRAGLRFNELDAWGVANGYPKLKAPAGTDGMIARRLLALAKKMKGQRKFAEAIPKYLEVLNAYPETQATGEALGGLAKCFAEIGDAVSAMATAEYAAERFAGDESAGTAVRSMASFYFKQKNNELAGQACKLLGLNFLEDPYSPQLLYGAAELERGEKKNAEANRLYEFIVANYAKDEYAVKAANRLGFSAYEANDFDNAVKYFEKGVELSVPGPKRAEGWFRLANSYVKIDKIREAIVKFRDLKKELDPNGPDKQLYYGNEADKKTSMDLLQQSSFFFGQALTQALTKIPDPDKGAPLRNMAIAEFEEFLEKYPKSDFAPKCLQKLGMLYLQGGDVEAAIKYFEQIPKKYPDFPGANDIIYLIVDSAGTLGKKDVVETYTRKMLDKSKEYSSGQLIRVGMRVVDFELFELAEECMRIVSKHPDAIADPQIEQRALYGLGFAAFKRGNYKESGEALDALLAKYPKSSNKLDAMFLQAACHREMKNCDKAMEILGEVTSQARDLSIKYPDRAQEFAAAELKKEAELALTNAACGDLGGAINSVILLLKTRVARTDDEVAIFKDLALKGIDWSIEAEKWKVGEDICQIFLETWPLDNENKLAVQQKRSTCQSNQ